MTFLKKGRLWVMSGYLLSAMAVISGCTDKPQESAKRTFPFVTVPTVYADAVARAEYLAIHYWDNFDFSDTAYVNSASAITEQAIVDYITVLPYASYNVIVAGVKHLMDQAEKHPAMYAYFSSKMESYLFDVNSQLRNDEFYIPVLEHLVASDSLNEPRKMRPTMLLAALQKNRPGSQATDIHFTTESGRKASLYDFQTDYTLLMFHNLDCGNCKEMTAQIDASDVVKEMLKQRKLSIVAIYPGQDIEAWRKHLSEMPKTWTNGYDHDAEIGKTETYVLRIIPTLYVLDKNHKIVMKDAPFNYVEFYFNNILNPQTQVVNR
ncbi:MAG: DUF5106 domain-containing protein [Tannerella sp.]|jgi:hypothetical protein|nr:DUF5106 domain-containing protein [Tannerella sp.]